MTDTKFSPDAEVRLLNSIQSLYSDHQRNTVALGKALFLFRNLLSERNMSGSRTSSGHGDYCKKLDELGINRRRAAEWVIGHEILLGLRPVSDSPSAKQKARRRPDERELGGLPPVADPLGYFAALLPFEALQSAYRAAAQQLHSDHGGDDAQMAQLNDAWAGVKTFFEGRLKTAA
jgi:hypothetical protein